MLAEEKSGSATTCNGKKDSTTLRLTATASGEQLLQTFADGTAALEIDPVDHVPAHFAIGDDAGLAEDPQVVGGGWLREADLLGDLRHITDVCAVRLGGEQAEDFQAQWVSNRPELPGEGFEINV